MVSSSAAKSTVSNNNNMSNCPTRGLSDDEGGPDGFYTKYEPKEVLGKGLSSVVRRCVDKSTGVQFAVKIIDVSDSSQIDEDGLDLRALTKREAEILERVSGHEHIVALHDFYESQMFIFLVFELCVNGELFDFLTSKITLTEKRVRSIMKQILEAIQHCHKMNIVHRDLKPENILLDDDFNVKLTDFGFAKVLSDNQRLYEVCGTPGYLAPELLKAGMLERDECPGYGVEVDAWACGVIMFTLLVGCPPFWHRKQLTMIRLIMEARYSFSSPEWDAVTDESKNLISRFLTVDPEKRITVHEALKHPVFQANLEEEDEEEEEDDNQKEVKKPEIVREKSKSFKRRKSTKKKLNLRQKFRIALISVQFTVRIRRLKFTPEPLSLKEAAYAPYSMRMFRKVIDNGAFRIYNHWVKRGEGQNRAALFEHYAKKPQHQLNL